LGRIEAVSQVRILIETTSIRRNDLKAGLQYARKHGEGAMSDLSGPPFRADHVGSLLRPPELLRAR
jgi:hypothetical protein